MRVLRQKSKYFRSVCRTATSTREAVQILSDIFVPLTSTDQERYVQWCVYILTNNRTDGFKCIWWDKIDMKLLLQVAHILEAQNTIYKYAYDYLITYYNLPTFLTFALSTFGRKHHLVDMVFQDLRIVYHLTEAKVWELITTKSTNSKNSYNTYPLYQFLRSFDRKGTKMFLHQSWLLRQSGEDDTNCGMGKVNYGDNLIMF